MDTDKNINDNMKDNSSINIRDTDLRVLFEPERED